MMKASKSGSVNTKLYVFHVNISVMSIPVENIYEVLEKLLPNKLIYNPHMFNYKNKID